MGRHRHTWTFIKPLLLYLTAKRSSFTVEALINNQSPCQPCQECSCNSDTTSILSKDVQLVKHAAHMKLASEDNAGRRDTAAFFFFLSTDRECSGLWGCHIRV